MYQYAVKDTFIPNHQVPAAVDPKITTPTPTCAVATASIQNPVEMVVVDHCLTVPTTTFVAMVTFSEGPVEAIVVDLKITIPTENCAAMVSYKLGHLVIVAVVLLGITLPAKSVARATFSQNPTGLTPRVVVLLVSTTQHNTCAVTATFIQSPQVQVVVVR